MANVFSIKTLKDTTKSTVLKLVGKFDSTTNEDNSTRIDVSSFSGAISSYNILLVNGGAKLPYYGVNIKSVWFSISNGLSVKLYSNGDNLKTMISLSGNGNYGPEESGIPITNYEANTVYGNIGLKTLNASANSSYSLIIELKKDNKYYNMGQLSEGQAFNYHPNYEDILLVQNGDYLDTQDNNDLEVPGLFF